MLHMAMLGIDHILSYMIAPIYYKTEGFFSFFTGKKIPTESKLLFVHQSAYQKSLIKKYGNRIASLDAPYKTTK